MRKRSEDSRYKIILAARGVFIDKGYAAATMDTIALHSGTTKRTVYGYFTDKKELFKAVVEDVVGQPWEFDAPIESIATPAEFYKALYNIASAINDVFAIPGYIEIMRIIISEVNAQPELSTILDRGITRRSINVLVKLFNIAAEKDILKVNNPLNTAHRFVGGFLTGVYLDGLTEPSPGKVHKFTSKELADHVNSYLPHLIDAINEQQEDTSAD